MSKSKKIIISAFFIAINIILSRLFSIKTPIITISFGFVPIMLAAIILGPKHSIIIAGLGDFIGAILFPIGPYFFGFTLSACLSGCIYGFLLYTNNNDISKKQFIFKLILSSVLVLILVNGVLNTVWLFIITNKAMLVIAPIRLIKQLVLLPIQVIIIYLLNIALKPQIKKFTMEVEHD